MTHAETTPEGRTPRVSDLTVGEALLALAGPLVWAGHFMLTYLAAEGACRLGALGGSWLGLTGLGWFMLAATVIAIGVAVWAGLRGYRRWRTARGEAGRALETRPGELVALAGWVLSLVFTGLIVLSLVPLVVLRPCAWN